MANRPAVQNIPGFPDVTGPAQEEKSAIQQALFDYIGLAGYKGVDTPVVEEADLFLRKSGGELASRMYAFTDPGGHRVALRPEFTASVIRAFIHQQAQDNVPIRWRYQGPIFRYTPDRPDLPYQRTQVGAEIMGRGDPLADAEALALACGGLRSVDLTDVVVTLGHPGVMQRLLEGFSLSERAVHFLMQNIGAVREGRADEVRELALETGLTRNADSLVSGLNEMDMGAVQAVLHQMLTNLGTTAGGGRDLEQIERRFLEKLRSADNPDVLDRALAFISELCTVRGEVESVLSQAAGLAKTYGLDPQPLERLEEVLGLATKETLGAPRVVADLGLVRGLAYYTGIVFEVRHRTEEGAILCGGGRYDGLVQALGGPDIPALGFAFTVEPVLDALKAEGRAVLPRGARSRSTRVSASDSPSAVEALKRAIQQWDAGKVAELTPEGRVVLQRAAGT